MTINFITDPAPEYVYTEELGFNTLISRFENKVEQRRDKTSQGRGIFNLNYKVKTSEEIWRLYNFYRICQGSKKAFSFVSPIPALLPYDQIVAWWPFHDGELTKIEDWNGYIYPTYSCRFAEDNLSFDEFSVRIRSSSLRIIQESVISFTNNYGTLTGTATWLTCPDGSNCVNFDGSSGECSMGDAAALDVGTTDFSLALAIYPNSLGTQLRVLSKKTNATSTNKGYHLLISTAGTITFVLSDGTNQNTITSAAGIITNQTWKLITITVDRGANGQIYVNNVASGSTTTMTSTANADNANNFYVGRAEGIGYGNFRVRHLIFAKKLWTQTEMDTLWKTLRGTFQI